MSIQARSTWSRQPLNCTERSAPWGPLGAWHSGESMAGDAAAGATLLYVPTVRHGSSKPQGEWLGTTDQRAEEQSKATRTRSHPPRQSRESNGGVPGALEPRIERNVGPSLQLSSTLSGSGISSSPLFPVAHTVSSAQSQSCDVILEGLP
jgi:hypothetical protein